MDVGLSEAAVVAPCERAQALLVSDLWKEVALNDLCLVVAFAVLSVVAVAAEVVAVVEVAVEVADLWTVFRVEAEAVVADGAEAEVFDPWTVVRVEAVHQWALASVSWPEAVAVVFDQLAVVAVEVSAVVEAFDPCLAEDMVASEAVVAAEDEACPLYLWDHLTVGEDVLSLRAMAWVAL